MSTFTTSEADRQRSLLKRSNRAISAKIPTAASKMWRGRPKDPVWERPALLLLLSANALLYGWNLGINGWANYFYSAAVQAGSIDAKAFFFGSSDWGNSITVDKPPLSLWVMGLSVRLFGLSPIAMLLPQVLMGVGTTLLIYLILRRCVSAVAALFGATVFFTTPIVVLMSRYNNPDPLMLLLMVAAVWFAVRAVDSGRGRFFVVAGALLGLAFMTKQLQGLLSVPAIGLAYLICSPQLWQRRLITATAALGTLIVTGGLWMTAVDLIPSDQRPYIGGSVSNSVLELTLAYNGINRVAGGGVAPADMQIPAQFRPVDSDAGLFRLLNANFNQEASWLLYAGLLALVVLAVGGARAKMAPSLRALSLIAGAWLVTAFLLLSLMSTEIHSYYTASLAPPLALVLGVALDTTLAGRERLQIRVTGALASLVALLSSWLILAGTEGWPDWLPTVVLLSGIVSLSGLCVKPPSRRVEITAAALLAAAVLSGPVITSIHNVTVGFNGSNPLSGPVSKNPATLSQLLAKLRNNEIPWAHDMAFGRDPDPEVVGMLTNTIGCDWAAATYASQTAARLQLESGVPVMPVGGFAGSDPFPTLKEFQAKVARGEICYLIQQEAFVAVQDQASVSVQISNWVQDNFLPEKRGNTTVYRLAREN